MSFPNPFAFLFKPITSSFSGLVNLGSDISLGFGNLVSAIGYGLENFAKAIASIPSDILNALNSLGVALWHALQSVGAFLYAGFHDIASGVMGGLNEIRKGFTYIGESLIKFADAFRQDLINFGAVIGQLFTSFGNIFVSIWNDLKFIGSVIYNALVQIWNALVAFANDVANLIINAFSTVSSVLNIPQLISDIPQLVTGFAKQESTRLAGAFPRVTGFNVTLEAMKRKLQRGDLKFTDVILYPIKSAILGAVVESIMQSFYPEISNVSQYQYNTQKTVPQLTSSSVSSTQHQPLSGATQTQTPQITPPSIPPVTPFSLVQPSVIGVKVEDVLAIGTQTSGTIAVTISGNIESNVGGYTVSQLVQTFSDTFGISANLIATLLQTLGVSIADSLQPTIYGQTFQQGFTPIDAITLDYVVSVGILQLPPPLQLCTQKYVPTSTIISGESATDQLSVYVQECVPIYNIATDTFYASGTSSSSLLQPNYTDTLIVDGLDGSAVVGFAQSTSYTGSILYSQNGFT